MRFSLILLFLFFFSSIGYGQDTIYVYYDNNWNPVKKSDDADYYRKAYRTEDKIWIVNDYYKSHKIQMTGKFKTKRFKQKLGHYTYYYENGNRSSEGEYKDGERNGFWQFWFEDGKKKSEGEIKNGLYEGHWKFYYENGNQKSEGYFINDLRANEWKFWEEDGKISSQGSYKDGKLDADWIYWYENGKKRSQGKYLSGEKDGEWTYWNETGNIETKEFYENKALYKSVGYFENGNKKFLWNSTINPETGIWTSWNSDGFKTLSGNIENGRREGEWIRYFPDNSEMKLIYRFGELFNKDFGGIIRMQRSED